MGTTNEGPHSATDIKQASSAPICIFRFTAELLRRDNPLSCAGSLHAHYDIVRMAPPTVRGWPDRRSGMRIKPLRNCRHRFRNPFVACRIVDDRADLMA